jgi:hypothetical protein
METLRKAYQSSCNKTHKETVNQLLWFELNDDDKTALMAWRAVILSTKAKVPPPPWAGTIFEQVLDGYITGEVRDLAVAFGLKGSRGRDSEYLTKRLRFRDNELSQNVRFYCLQGATVRKACSMVANRIAEERETVNETIYNLIPSQYNSMTFAQTLAKKIYPRWLSQQRANATLDGIDRALKDQSR